MMPLQKIRALCCVLLVMTINMAYAKQQYNIDLNKYEIGDIPQELGSVVVTNGKKIKGKTVLISFQKGGFEFSLPHPLSGNFEVKFTGYNLTAGSNVIQLHSLAKPLIWKLYWARKIEITQGEIIRMPSYKANEGGNDFHIVAKGRVVKLFVNGNFVGSQLQDPTTTYDTFSIDMNKLENELTNISFLQK
jgi:hypothetical protein